MIPLRALPALGVAVALAVPCAAQGQMVRRPQQMGGEMRVPATRRESALPPIRMGSLQPYNAPSGGHDDYGYRGYSYGGRYGYSRYSYAWVYDGYSGRSARSRVGRSAGAVYTQFWLPALGKIWSPASLDAAADTPERANDASRVLHIEDVNDSGVRVTWLGSTRPIRQARVFLADSVQQVLRGRPVDQGNPSAVLPFADLPPRIRYVGLTVTFGDGLIESTLVPYTPKVAQRP
ncbi:MAG TPA: hypothetical protein VJ717_09355 [Gemmatimonadaceae bacterium]|nr:hypothetical protein [Gemmatimonadaceae bacterium]